MEKENYVEEDAVVEMYEPHFSGLMIRRLQEDQIFGIYVYNTNPKKVMGLDSYAQHYLVGVVSKKNDLKTFEFIKNIIDYQTIPSDKEKELAKSEIEQSNRLLEYLSITSFFKFCDIKTKTGKLLDKRIYFETDEYSRIMDVYKRKVPNILCAHMLNKKVLKGLVDLIKVVDKFSSRCLFENSLILDNYKTRTSDMIFNMISFTNYIDDLILMKSLKEDFNGVTVKVTDPSYLKNEACDDCGQAVNLSDFLYFVEYDEIGYSHTYKKKRGIGTITVDTDDKRYSSYCRGHAYINNSIWLMDIMPKAEFMNKYNEERGNRGYVTNETMLIMGKLPEIGSVFTDINFVRTICGECGSPIKTEIE